MVLYTCVEESKLFRERILNFGTGFGITANHLAAQNVVTEVEPDPVMIDYEDLKKYIAGRFAITEIYGVRTIFGLQKNECKSNNDWISSMYELESLAERILEFRKIAFYHHIHLERSWVR